MNPVDQRVGIQRVDIDLVALRRVEVVDDIDGPVGGARVGDPGIDKPVGTGPAETGLTAPPAAPGAPLAEIVPTVSRLVRSGTEPGARIRVGVIADDAIALGQALRGPALIERWDTSIWVPEGATARRDTAGSIIVEVA